MELINEPNKAITKTNFLKALKEAQGTALHIVSTGQLFRSNLNNKLNFFVNFQVLDNLKCEVVTSGNNTTTQDINGEIVGIPFPLQEEPGSKGDSFIISNKTNIYPILNQALIKMEKVPEGNRKGFHNVTFKEITETLEGFTFLATATTVTETQYKPYNKITVVGAE